MRWSRRKNVKRGSRKWRGSRRKRGKVNKSKDREQKKGGSRRRTAEPEKREDNK